MAILKERLPPLGSIVSFEAAARSGSHALAARRLGVTPAAVSRQVARLEESLGVKLFRPMGRGRSLTGEGRELFEAVSVGLEHVAAAVARLRRQGTSATLTIASPLAFASLWLIPRIVSFRRRHPEIQLRFVTADADLDPVAEHIGLAVRYGSGEWPHLAVTPLLQPTVFPVCSPDYLRACGGLGSLDDLFEQTLLDREEEDSFGIYWRTWLAGLDRRPRRALHRIRFTSYEIVIRAALAGQGVALGVDALVDDLLEQKLLVSPLDYRVRWKEAYFLVSPLGEKLTPEMQLFADWLLAEARSAVAGRSAPARSLLGRARGRPPRTAKRLRARGGPDHDDDRSTGR